MDKRNHETTPASVSTKSIRVLYWVLIVSSYGLLIPFKIAVSIKVLAPPFWIYYFILHELKYSIFGAGKVFLNYPLNPFKRDKIFGYDAIKEVYITPRPMHDDRRIKIYFTWKGRKKKDSFYLPENPNFDEIIKILKANNIKIVLIKSYLPYETEIL